MLDAPAGSNCTETEKFTFPAPAGKERVHTLPLVELQPVHAPKMLPVDGVAVRLNCPPLPASEKVSLQPAFEGKLQSMFTLGSFDDTLPAPVPVPVTVTWTWSNAPMFSVQAARPDHPTATARPR